MVSRVSVNVRVRFRFIGANLYIAMTPPKLHSSLGINDYSQPTPTE